MNWRIWLIITEVLFALCGVSHGIEVPACRVTVPDASGPGRSHGSGVLVATDEQASYILTNAHVVRDGRGEAELSFPSSPVRPGRVIAADEKWDVAIIQTEPCKSDPTPIALAPLQRGDKLMAGGFGQQGQWRDMVGQVAAFYGPVGGGEYDMFEMTGGQARQGDSGGPIANERGELVGLIWGSSNGTSMGTPISKAVELCQSYGICIGQQCQPPRVRVDNRPILGGQRIVVTQPKPKPVGVVVPLKPVAQVQSCQCSGEIASLKAQIAKLEAALESKSGCDCEAPKPTTVAFLDGSGRVYSSQTVPPGGTLKIPPNHVQNFSRDGKLIDEEKYPVGSPIKLRHGVPSKVK